MNYLFIRCMIECITIYHVECGKTVESMREDKSHLRTKVLKMCPVVDLELYSAGLFSKPVELIQKVIFIKLCRYTCNCMIVRLKRFSH